MIWFLKLNMVCSCLMWPWPWTAEQSLPGALKLAVFKRSSKPCPVGPNIGEGKIIILHSHAFSP